MKLLELYCGMSSVKNIAKQVGYKVTSQENIKCDILDFEYKAFEQGYFAVILALPPCTEYLRAKTIETRNILFANVIVKQILKTIEYLKPRFYFIIDSQTVLLKYQYMMQSLNYEDVDCCKYGMQ